MEYSQRGAMDIIEVMIIIPLEITLTHFKIDVYTVKSKLHTTHNIH